MSSQDSISTVYTSMMKGAADYLVKPLRRNELRNLWQHVWRRQAVCYYSYSFSHHKYQLNSFYKHKFLNCISSTFVYFSHPFKKRLNSLQKMRLQAITQLGITKTLRKGLILRLECIIQIF